MSDTPISSEYSCNKKESHVQGDSVPKPSFVPSRLADLSEYALAPRPSPVEDSREVSADPELLLPEIIKNVPDIIYEFARDAVIALSERERFTPNEIGSLRKAEVIPGGIEIRGRRISEETTTSLAVYIGAVRTYLPSGQWASDSTYLFEVSGQKVSQGRPAIDFAKIENSEKIIRDYLDERDSREDESNLTDEEREALRRAPARIIRLSGTLEKSFPPLREESNKRSNGILDDEKSLQAKALQENADSVSERLEGLMRTSQSRVDNPLDAFEKNGPPENIVAHSNFSRALIRDLLESHSREGAVLSSDIQEELGESVEALEKFYTSINSTSHLAPVEKTGLRFNCELIVIQLRKLLRGVHLQSGSGAEGSSALLHLDRDHSSELSFSEKLERVLQDLQALRKKSSSIF